MTASDDPVNGDHAQRALDAPLQKDPRFWTSAAAIGLFILIIYLFFAPSTGQALISVTGESGGTTTADHDVHCRALSGLGSSDWPQDENGDRALTSVAGNDTIINEACNGERLSRGGWILVLAIPTIILGVRVAMPKPVTNLHSSPTGD